MNNPRPSPTETRFPPAHLEKRAGRQKTPALLFELLKDYMYSASPFMSL